MRWNHSREALETYTRGGLIVDITHGDGEWIVVRKFETLPWTQEAVLLPAAMLWAGIAYGLADWAATLRSHGQAKIAAQLPEGSSLEERSADDTIALSPEARSVLQTISDMVSGDSGAGIFPAGTKVDFLSNGSTASAVFEDFITNREKSAARIYNGTDATMGSQGGAPGVDISVLFGVAPPLGESIERYEIEVRDSGDVLLASATALSATYTTTARSAGDYITVWQKRA